MPGGWSGGVTLHSTDTDGLAPALFCHQSLSYSRNYQSWWRFAADGGASDLTSHGHRHAQIPSPLIYWNYIQLHAIRYISYHGYIATIPLSYLWYKSMVLSMVNSQLYIATTTIRVRHKALTPKANVQTETLHFSLSSCQIRARYTIQYTIYIQTYVLFLTTGNFCTFSFALAASCFFESLLQSVSFLVALQR